MMQDDEVNFIIILSTSLLYLQLHKHCVFSKTNLLLQSTHKQIYTECAKKHEKGVLSWLAG